jgi:hypothetical protein
MKIPNISGQTTSNAMAMKTTLISAFTDMKTPVVPVKVSKYTVPIQRLTSSSTGDLSELEISMVVKEAMLRDSTKKLKPIGEFVMEVGLKVTDFTITTKSPYLPQELVVKLLRSLTDLPF